MKHAFCLSVLTVCKMRGSVKCTMFVTRSSISTGFIIIQRESRPRDPEQIVEKCAYCQGPSHSPTECPIIIQEAWPSLLQRQMTPISIPKPKEDLTSPKHPNHPTKP